MSHPFAAQAAPGAQADAHKLRDFERSIARFFSPEEWLAELDPVLVKSGGELEREAAFEAERTRRLSDAHPLARPHVGVAYSGLMGDLKVNDLPEIDDALYLKHEHEYKPSEEEPFDDKYPQHCWSCDPLPNENNEDYEFYLCGTTVSLEMSPSLQPPPPPIETVEREGIVDGITYRNESLFNPEFPYTRGFIEAVTT